MFRVSIPHTLEFWLKCLISQYTTTLLHSNKHNNDIHNNLVNHKYWQWILWFCTILDQKVVRNKSVNWLIAIDFQKYHPLQRILEKACVMAAQTPDTPVALVCLSQQRFFVCKLPSWKVVLPKPDQLKQSPPPMHSSASLAASVYVMHNVYPLHFRRLRVVLTKLTGFCGGYCHCPWQELASQLLEALQSEGSHVWPGREDQRSHSLVVGSGKGILHRSIQF